MRIKNSKLLTTEKRKKKIKKKMLSGNEKWPRTTQKSLEKLLDLVI